MFSSNLGNVHTLFHIFFSSLLSLLSSVIPIITYVVMINGALAFSEALFIFVFFFTPVLSEMAKNKTKQKALLPKLESK